MDLSENMERSAALVAEGSPAPGPTGGRGGPGVGGAQKSSQDKIKSNGQRRLTSGETGDDQQRPGSAVLRAYARA